jgi:membrane associated rhomboid family serine protease
MQVSPRLVYLLMFLQVAVQFTALQIMWSQGKEAQEEFLSVFLCSYATVFKSDQFFTLMASQLLYSSTQQLLQGLATLWLVGVEVESVLGIGAFSTLLVLSGCATTAAACIFNDGLVASGSYLSIALLGALLGYKYRNLDVDGSLRPMLVAGALGIGHVVLVLVRFDLPDVVAQLVGIACGLWLGYSLGPKFCATTEVDIPEGFMHIPEDAREVKVVVDLNTRTQKLVVGCSFAAVSALVVALANMAMRH